MTSRPTLAEPTLRCKHHTICLYAPSLPQSCSRNADSCRLRATPWKGCSCIRGRKCCCNAVDPRSVWPQLCRKDPNINCLGSAKASSYSEEVRLGAAARGRLRWCCEAIDVGNQCYAVSHRDAIHLHVHKQEPPPPSPPRVLLSVASTQSHALTTRSTIVTLPDVSFRCRRRWRRYQCHDCRRCTRHI